MTTKLYPFRAAYPLNSYGDACGWCCGLYLVGYTPFDPDRKVTPSDGYELYDGQYLDNVRNGGILVSFVPPDPRWVPEEGEVYVVHNLPTGHKLYVSYLTTWKDPVIDSDPGDPACPYPSTNYEAWNPADHTAIAFPSISTFFNTANVTAKYAFLVRTKNQFIANLHCLENWELLHTSPWIVNLSYPDVDNPRLQYMIYMRKD